MKPLLAWLFSALMTVAAVAADAPKSRFSQTLSPTELAATGLNRLSSDQVAVLDALVRRDLNTLMNPRRGDPEPATRFSQRLTEDERRNAGFPTLTEAEVTQLDAFAERNASVSLARSLLAPAVFVPSGVRLREDSPKTGPEIHGSMSISYGWGKGYSEKTGSMDLRFEDPSGRFSLNVGYSESRIKTPYPYRDVTGAPLLLPLAP